MLINVNIWTSLMSGNSFNFSNFHFLKKHFVLVREYSNCFQKCSKVYIRPLHVQYECVDILTVIRLFTFFNMKYEHSITLNWKLLPKTVSWKRHWHMTYLRKVAEDMTAVCIVFCHHIEQEWLNIKVQRLMV